MSTLTFIDEAHRFRIEIEGRLAGASVAEVRDRWRSELRHVSSRTFTIDISQLTGCDRSGFRLLREMYGHGTSISARNARSLEFLNEISSPEAAGPALVYTADGEAKRKAPKASLTQFPKSKAAGVG